MNFYPSCEPVHDDGDGVVVIMYVNDLCGDCGCVHSMGGSKVHKVDRALSEGTTDCLHNQDRMTLNWAVESWDC